MTFIDYLLNEFVFSHCFLIYAVEYCTLDFLLCCFYLSLNLDYHHKPEGETFWFGVEFKVEEEANAC